MITTIIFDMDGVLVDSEPATVAASVETLAEWGITALPGEFHEFTGMGDDKFIGGVAAKHGTAYDPAMKARMYGIFVERAAERVGVMPWSRALIGELTAAGYKVSVASASDYKKVAANIGCIGCGEDCFTAIITGSDVTRKKPSPDIYLKAAEKSDSDPSRCLCCEDALSGVAAVKAAGMVCVAVTTSFSREDLRGAGADYVVDDLAELSVILKNINNRGL